MSMESAEARKSEAGAGDGNRTHVLSLGSSGPAIERRPPSCQMLHLVGVSCLLRTGFAGLVLADLAHLPDMHPVQQEYPAKGE